MDWIQFGWVTIISSVRADNAADLHDSRCLSPMLLSLSLSSYPSPSVTEMFNGCLSLWQRTAKRLCSPNVITTSLGSTTVTAWGHGKWLGLRANVPAIGRFYFRYSYPGVFHAWAWVELGQSCEYTSGLDSIWSAVKIGKCPTLTRIGGHCRLAVIIIIIIISCHINFAYYKKNARALVHG